MLKYIVARITAAMVLILPYLNRRMASSLLEENILLSLSLTFFVGTAVR